MSGDAVSSRFALSSQTSPETPPLCESRMRCGESSSTGTGTVEAGGRGTLKSRRIFRFTELFFSLTWI